MARASRVIHYTKRGHTMKSCNGWSNYETWRVNLEIFDGMTLKDFCDDDAHELAESLRYYAEEIIFATSSMGLARDYALAFLSDVNWLEIANRLLEEAKA
jgi:hypothetical protein